jgi:hypothetical protein
LTHAAQDLSRELASTLNQWEQSDLLAGEASRKIMEWLLADKRLPQAMSEVGSLLTQDEHFAAELHQLRDRVANLALNHGFVLDAAKAGERECHRLAIYLGQEGMDEVVSCLSMATHALEECQAVIAKRLQHCDFAQTKTHEA